MHLFCRLLSNENRRIQQYASLIADLFLFGTINVYLELVQATILSSIFSEVSEILTKYLLLVLRIVLIVHIA